MIGFRSILALVIFHLWVGAGRADSLVFEVDSGLVVPVALSADPTGVLVAVADETHVEIHDAHDGSLVAEFAIGGCCIADLAFVDASLLAIAIDGGEGAVPLTGMQVWDVETGTSIYTDTQVGNCRQLDMSDHGLALIGACDRGAPVWTMVDSLPARVGLISDRPLQSAAIDPAGELAVFVPVARDGSRAPAEVVTLYQLNGDEGPLATVVLPAPVRRLDWVGASNFLSVSRDGVLRLHEFAGGAIDLADGDVQGLAESVAPSPWGSMIAGDFRDGGLIAASDGAIIVTEAAVPMRGAGQWAFGNEATTLFWFGRPPTYPTSVLRRWAIAPPS